MKKLVSNALKVLAEEFNKKAGSLYVVGGFVRNYFLGYPQNDIDICGTLTINDVQKICDENNFECKVVNKKLGTVLIITPTDRFEYTTFRKENYIKGGSHSPSEVQFVADISEDAKRRDFTVNAIYYDILNDKFVDFYNGIKHVKQKLIKCVETPEFVFSSDGLRLLRLVRFASILNFKIDHKTMKVAKQNAFMLKDISKERVTKEFREIVVADYKYGVNKFNAIKLCNKLNLFKFTFNLDYFFKINTKNKHYKNFIKADSEFRFLSFLILILLNYFNFKPTSVNNITFVVNRLFGNNGIKCGEDLNSIIKTYLFIQMYFFEKHSVYLFSNYHNLNGIEKCVANVFCNKQYLSENVSSLKLNNIPLNEKMLKLTSADLLEVVNKENISNIKKQLLNMCLMGQLKNEKEELILKAVELNEELNKGKNR